MNPSDESLNKLYNKQPMTDQEKVEAGLTLLEMQWHNLTQILHAARTLLEDPVFLAEVEQAGAQSEKLYKTWAALNELDPTHEHIAEEFGNRTGMGDFVRAGMSILDTVDAITGGA